MKSRKRMRILIPVLAVVLVLAAIPLILSIHTNAFTDVKSGDYFYDAVLWANEEGIALGISQDSFQPGSNCTRGQAVTFLWRAFGKPEPGTQKHPFADVRESDYFYKAVLWAVEKEITFGTSATAFSPAGICSRGQIVTFLWRAVGKPAPQTDACPFTDVSEGDYYYRAVLWANENGIVKGTSTTSFSPGSDCTRGQIVTILYRSRDVISGQAEETQPESADPSAETETTEPENPTTPTEPENPTTPTEPENPTTPTEPENPTTPTEPENPTTPTEPEEPTDETDPNQGPWMP